MHIRPLVTLIICLLSGAFCTMTQAAPITFREGLANDYTASYAGTADTTLFSVNSVPNWANSNAGGANVLLSSLSSNRRRTIIRFDLSALSGQGLIVNGDATLVLTKSSAPSVVTTPEVALNAYQVLPANAGWNEGNGPNDPTNSTAQLGEATWNNKAHDATPWAGSPGLGGPGDLSASFFTGTFNYAAAAGSTLSITVPASLIQSWIDTPSGNAGIYITTASPGSTTTANFASSEHATAAWRPSLTVDAAVPEPATFGLLAVGATSIALRRRRRRLD